jgi:hypothetical protein
LLEIEKRIASSHLNSLENDPAGKRQESCCERYRIRREVANESSVQRSDAEGSSHCAAN